MLRPWVYLFGLVLGLAAIAVGGYYSAGWESATFYTGIALFLITGGGWLTRPVKVIPAPRHAPARSPLDGD